MAHDGVMVHPTAEVSDEADIGEGTSIWHQAQIRENCKIGKNCRLGKGVYVDYDVVLGDNVKVQNYVSIYHGVSIGSDVFLGPHCVFTNDLYPRSFIGDFEVGRTFVDDGASIGTNAVIICGNKVGKYAMVGAGSVVTKDVPPYGLVMGNPARLKGYVCVRGHKMVQKEGSLYHCEECGVDLDISQ